MISPADQGEPIAVRVDWKPARSTLAAMGVRSKVVHSRCGFFVIRLFSITAASLRFPSEFATVMVIDAKRNANFRGRLKNCQ